MTVTLVVFTDGRDHIYETIPSALARLQGPITRRIIYDDSDSAENRQRLEDAFPTFVITHHPDGRQGFGGAIRFMWQHLAARDKNEWIWHAEDDFLYNRDVDLEAMTYVMVKHPELKQMALRRQPWNAEERAAGGIVEVHPDDYLECEEGPYNYLIHRRFWTTNPCLYRRTLCLRGWPSDPHSEGHFGAMLRDEQGSSPFAFWGKYRDEPWVEHIGRERVGTGY